MVVIEAVVTLSTLPSCICVRGGTTVGVIFPQNFSSSFSHFRFPHTETRGVGTGCEGGFGKSMLILVSPRGSSFWAARVPFRCADVEPCWKQPFFFRTGKKQQHRSYLYFAVQFYRRFFPLVATKTVVFTLKVHAPFSSFAVSACCAC